MTPKTKVVTIIPFKKGPFGNNLTYFSNKDIKSGDIVETMLRSKKILGLVISAEDATLHKSEIKKMNFDLKKIVGVKEYSLFDKEFLASLRETSKYFAIRENDVASALIPSVLKENYDKIAKFSADTKNNKENSKEKTRAEKLLLQEKPEDRISFYKTLIRGSFAEKKSVFMVLPTLKDIEELEKELGRGIEQFTIKLHSEISPKKILSGIEKILTLPHPVFILGTAPFLSVPREDLATIILERENTGAYRMLGHPFIDLRIFAEIFASKINAKFILADTLLRLESIARIEFDYFTPISPLSYRINFEGEIEILDMGEKFQVLKGLAKEEMTRRLVKKQNIFIFTLRKGLATLTLCRDCGETLFCEKCSAPLVLYFSKDGKKRMFVCNKCNTEKSSDTVCPDCGSWNLMPLGIGVDTVYEEIKKDFPKAKIFKLSKESVKNQKGAEKIIKEFEESSGSILVGTQMALPYLKEKVPLSIIASFDTLWSIPNFKMSEKIIEILIALVSKTKDKIIIQTKNTKDDALLAVKGENLSSFVREELRIRKKLGYPPYKRFIKIAYTGNNLEVSRAREFLQKTFAGYSPEIFGGFITKTKNKYSTNALIKLDQKEWSVPALSLSSSVDERLSSLLSSLPPSFTVSVDPENLL